LKKIAISMRVTNAQNYKEVRDSLSSDWIDYFLSLNILPILIPNNIIAARKLLDEVNVEGVILSGGNNISRKYSKSGIEKDSYLERDVVEDFLLKYAVKEGIAALGVCRGAQFMNVFYGGVLHEGEASEHVATKHLVYCPDDFSFGARWFNVNSFHNTCIPSKGLSENCVEIARAEDGTIEAFKHKELEHYGIMWHPERTPTLIENRFFFNKVFNIGASL